MQYAYVMCPWGDLSMEFASGDSPTWMLSLLQVLAEDLWPRAAVGELDLDSEIIAKQAFRLLDTSSATWSRHSQLFIFVIRICFQGFQVVLFSWTASFVLDEVPWLNADEVEVEASIQARMGYVSPTNPTNWSHI